MGSDQLQGKCVVVTGASSGIGRAAALAFAKRGANVVLAARRQDALEVVAELARESGVETLVVPTDICDRSQTKQLVEASLARFGRIDVFVANAGTYFRCPVQELTIEDVENMMSVNFYGGLYCILEVLPSMLARGAGHIVVVASLDGKKAIPPDGAYAASKFAITGLAETLRQELHGTGVHVSTVFPGRIDTPMIADVQVPSSSPKIPAEKVAEAMVRAVLKKKPEVFVPHLGGRALILINTLSPDMGDRLVRRLHLEGLVRH